MMRANGCGGKEKPVSIPLEHRRAAPDNPVVAATSREINIMGESPPRRRWRDFALLLPAWFPSWLVAGLAVGGITVALCGNTLDNLTWTEYALAFAFGFGFSLLVLSYVYYRARPSDQQSGLCPPKWIRWPLIAVTGGVAVFFWLDKQAVPAGQGIPDVGEAPWLLLAGAVWFALLLLIYLGQVARAAAWGSEITLRPSVVVLLLSVLAGGAVGYGALMLLWPEARAGWHVVFVVLAVFIGMAGGTAVWFGLGYLRTSLSARLLARHLPYYREQLLIDDDAQRAAAARLISHMGRHAAPALLDLYAALRDDSAEVRAYSALAVLGIEPNLADPVVLYACLSDRDARVRVAAAAALLRQKAAPAPELVPIIAEGIALADLAFAGWAMRLLGELGPGAAGAMPLLRAAIIESDSPNHLAFGVLQHIGTASVPVLIEALAHPNQTTRMSAVMHLKSLGSAAREAIPALREACSDTKPVVRAMAEDALKSLEACAATADDAAVQ
jgi:hypothetical protein